MTDSKLGTDEDHSLGGGVRHVGGEALGAVAGELGDDLEVVELGLETSQELLTRRHQVGVQLEEVTNQLPQLLQTSD